MSKIKNLFFFLLFFAFNSSIFFSCETSNPYVYQQLYDLRAEVVTLDSLITEKQEENSKLQKQIEEIDKKIKNVQTDFVEVKERCP